MRIVSNRELRAVTGRAAAAKYLPSLAVPPPHRAVAVRTTPEHDRLGEPVMPDDMVSGPAGGPLLRDGVRTGLTARSPVAGDASHEKHRATPGRASARALETLDQPCPDHTSTTHSAEQLEVIVIDGNGHFSVAASTRLWARAIARAETSWDVSAPV